MAEQARETIKSLTESLANEPISAETREFSFADDEANISVFLDDSIKSDLSTENSALGSSVGNVSNTTLEVTKSVSDRVDTLGDEEPDREKIHEALSKAYATCMKRFERAVGDKVINNDIIKLMPVSKM